MAVERTVSLPNKLGLHARPAMQLVELANKFEASVQLTREGRTVDCKNMIAVLTLGAGQGAELIVSADGEDAQEAVESLCSIIEIGFGEE